MLKYPCLVLDHDDTVVRSEATVNYPSFLLALAHFRPGMTIELPEFTKWCFSPGFAAMCREKFGFSDQELAEEFQMWLRYVRDRVPPPFPGVERMIRRQKEAGGLICVVSHSGSENITRDYQTHFHLLPDAIYGWDLPEAQRKPSTFPLQDIMARYGLQPKELLVVDDLKPGFDMAKAAGVDMAFAGWGRKNVPEIPAFMKQYCDYSFDTVEELEGFLFP